MGVVADKGSETASIEDFVVAAGVSRGTFYNYFPSVDDLILAMNTHLAEGFDQRLAVVSEGVRDPALVLSIIAHEAFRIITVDPLRGWVALRIAGTSAPRQALVAARFDTIYQWAVSKGRFRTVEPDAARNLLFGAVRMAQAEILAQRATLTHTTDLVTLALTAYGLEAEEAAQISAAGRDVVNAKAHYSPVM